LRARQTRAAGSSATRHRPRKSSAIPGQPIASLAHIILIGRCADGRTSQEIANPEQLGGSMRLSQGKR
jgi:hypothetical protein